MIEYKKNQMITPKELAEVFDASGIVRPTQDYERMRRMLNNANILYTAWDGESLVGVLRGTSDMSYCTFVSDLAVTKEYQGLGIGAQLIANLRKDQGTGVSVILLSAPGAMKFYPKQGFELTNTAFRKQRRY